MAGLGYAAVALAAYFLGSIPFGYLLVRIFRKEDIRERGSGNIGATNVVRSGAKGLGAVTFLLDALKGTVAVLAGGWMATALGLTVGNAMALAALCATLGHMYTVWLGFKGGKGVATAFGVFVALSPWAAIGALAVFILALVISRYVSLASILAAIALPIIAFLTPGHHATRWTAVVAILIPAIVIVKHRANIGRLIRGTEYRFGKPKATAA